MAPKGNWETVYENMQPFGMGRVRYPVDAREKGEREVVRGLVPIRDVKYTGMANRMAKGEGIGGVV